VGVVALRSATGLRGDLLAAVRSESSWRLKARPEQLLPDGHEWQIAYLCGGRGSGKTRSGAEWLADVAWTEEPGDWGVVAPTFADARDKCVEGPSGLLAALGTNRAEVEAGRSIKVKTWNRSIGELVLRNGAVIHLDGADDGAPTVQGFNLRGCWCTEVGLWRRVKIRRGSRSIPPWQMAWEESVNFAVRVGNAHIVCDGTPKKGHPLVKRLLAGEADVIRQLRTMDNLQNLSPAFIARVVTKYRGTRLERQELEGVYLEDTEGALWTTEAIDADRAAPPASRSTDGAEVPDLHTVVVAVDPSASEDANPDVADAGGGGSRGDEAGIVVCGAGPAPAAYRLPDGNEDGLPHGYVLDDRSARYSPTGWANAAIDAYIDHHADYIVYEANQGGAMAATLLRRAAERRGLHVRIKDVHASRGKRTRAEPIAQLYDQHRIHHVEVFEELEDEQTTWVPGMDSPNRMDALVWALTELISDRKPSRMVYQEAGAPGLAAAAPAAEYRRIGSGRMRYFE
jgi:phage terminase large subunit-like protein